MFSRQLHPENEWGIVVEEESEASQAQVAPKDELVDTKVPTY